MKQNLDFLDSISVLVVGDLMLDRYLVGDVRRVSPEAPVPVVTIEEKRSTLGGAANVANNLIALGVEFDFFGVVGDDDSGREIDSILKLK